MSDSDQIAVVLGDPPVVRAHVENPFSDVIEYRLAATRLPDGWSQSGGVRSIAANGESDVDLILAPPVGTKAYDVVIEVELHADRDVVRRESVRLFTEVGEPKDPKQTATARAVPQTEGAESKEPPKRTRRRASSAIQSAGSESGIAEDGPSESLVGSADAKQVSPQSSETTTTGAISELSDGGASADLPQESATLGGAGSAEAIEEEFDEAFADGVEEGLTLPSYGENPAGSQQAGSVQGAETYGAQATTVNPTVDRIQDKYPDCLVDPVDEQVIALPLGGAQLVVFSHLNRTGSDVQLFVEWDDSDLPKQWGANEKGIKSQRTSVNVGRDDTNDVGFWIYVPKDTAPATYRIPVTTGVRRGEDAVETEHLVLVLRVEPRTGIVVSVPERSHWRAPFARKLEVEVEVQNAGNCATAYRLIAISSQIVEGRFSLRRLFGGGKPQPSRSGSKEGGALRHAPAPDPARWRLTWDRELDQLPAPEGTGLYPTNTHVLTCEREKLWWWGFGSKVRVTVEGTAVTDRRESLDGSNRHTIDLALYRPIPLVWFLSTPLLLMFIMFVGFGKTTLAITPDITGEYNSYILAKAKGEKGTTDYTLRGNIEASPLTLTRLEYEGQNVSGSTSYRFPGPINDVLKTKSNLYAEKVSITASPVVTLFNNRQTKDVWLVPIATSDQLDFNTSVKSESYPVELDGEGWKREGPSAGYSYKFPKEIKKLDIETWELALGERITSAVVWKFKGPREKTSFTIFLSNKDEGQKIRVFVIKSDSITLTGGLRPESNSGGLRPERNKPGIDSAEISAKIPNKPPSILGITGKIDPGQKKSAELVLLTTDELYRIIKFKFIFDGEDGSTGGADANP